MMSRTTYLHGVNRDLVLETLPVNTTTVTASSSGLNFGLVDSYIARAAGMVNAQLVRHGMSPDSLDPDSSQLAQDGIISYAAAFCLERMGGSPDQIERRMSEWKSILQLLMKEPQVMGSAQDVDSAFGVKSNISSRSDRSNWRSESYKYR